MEQLAILLAGGRGSRMGSATADKILLPLAGKPALIHAMQAFEASACCDGFVIVIRDDVQRVQIQEALATHGIRAMVIFTNGGKERQDSVQAALRALPASCKWVMIHDLARPAVSPRDIKAVHDALRQCAGAVGLAHRCHDTIRQFDTNPTNQPAPSRLLDRSMLWAMETPQAFPRSLIEQAHACLDVPVTDDLAALERLGYPVLLVESSSPNPKLTEPRDRDLIEFLLMQNRHTENRDALPAFLPSTRVGFGYDIHRFHAGRKLVLGGVEIPAEAGLLGHSDADVLCHAIADAILGAAGLPDIGHLFPNTDPAIAGISSLKIVERAVAEAAATGLRLVNIDATLIAEQPKIAPHIAAMKGMLAQATGLAVSAIGIKATTNEGIGSLGNADGIAAHAVATLQTNPLS